jgi:hypothetical protein
MLSEMMKGKPRNREVTGMKSQAVCPNTVTHLPSFSVCPAGIQLMFLETHHKEMFLEKFHGLQVNVPKRKKKCKYPSTWEAEARGC